MITEFERKITNALSYKGFHRDSTRRMQVFEEESGVAVMRRGGPSPIFGIRCLAEYSLWLSAQRSCRASLLESAVALRCGALAQSVRAGDS